ncbi:MAG TPA: PAS domain S-box protein, partial [Spirochaetia bacterium]|nr:PAS domain S-box protein [Spirochaetia bacterium]
WKDRPDTWVLTERMPLRDAEGRVIGTLGISKDITTRKLAEKEVEDTVSRYRDFIESAPIAFFRSDSNGRLYSANAAMAAMLGFQTGQDAVEYYTDIATQMYTDPAKRGELVALLREHGSVRDFVYPLRTVDGREIWMRTTARISERRGDGTFIIEGFSSDITENVRAEEETKRVAREYESVFHGAQDSIFLMEVIGPNQFRYTRNNQTHERTTGLSTEAIRGKTPLELLGRELGETVSANYQRCVDAKVSISYEETLDLPTGRRTWATTLTPVIRGGRVAQIVGVSQDITERRAAEEKIGGLLQEKEILLREVHHRIKNNLNTMSSLLSLQADSMTDKATVLALQDARSRMRSMGVLYDKLFLTENLREMSITEYLPTLADEIINLFPVRAVVKLEKHIDDFVLPVKELTSVGIIVNELLTNIMKHAFAGKAEGRIIVNASKKGGRITIGVGDDGVGIPESFNLEHSPGFGLMVIRALTKQLNGTVQIDRTNGTRFLLEFDSAEAH